MLQRAIRTRPHEPVALRLMARVHLEAGRLHEAMDVLEHVLMSGAPDDGLLRALCETGEKVGDREALLVRLRRLWSIHRRWPLLLAMAGVTLHNLDRLRQAEVVYRRAMRFGLHEPWLDLNLCRLLCKDGRPHVATRILRHALVRWPDNLELVYHLGLTYVGQRRPIEAQRIFARLAERDPNHAEAAYLAGDLLMQRGRKFYRRAAAYFHHAIEIDPDHKDALWNLAAICHCWRRIPEARQLLARAEAAGIRDPRLPDFKRSLGMA